MCQKKVNAFATHLAAAENGSASAQTQALCAPSSCTCPCSAARSVSSSGWSARRDPSACPSPSPATHPVHDGKEGEDRDTSVLAREVFSYEHHRHAVARLDAMCDRLVSGLCVRG